MFTKLYTDIKTYVRLLRLLSQQYTQEVHIIQLDNAPCYTANKLEIPDNIILYRDVRLLAERAKKASQTDWKAILSKKSSD